MATNLAQAVQAQVRAAIPAPNIKLGVVTRAVAPRIDSYGNPVRGRVEVSGLADASIACDWSSTFDAELRLLGRDLEGSRVEVHFDQGQALIAYRIILGDKS